MTPEYQLAWWRAERDELHLKLRTAPHGTLERLAMVQTLQFLQSKLARAAWLAEHGAK